MVLSISVISEPVGSVKAWLRATAATPLPANWLICDGSTVVDSSSAYNGKPLPDMRGKFLRGHNTLDNSNFAADVNYYAGGTVPTGGADNVDLSHVHGVTGHIHTTQTAGAHSHTISSDGDHFHIADAGQPNFGGSFAYTSPGGVTETDGAHDHSGNTGSVAAHSHTVDSASESVLSSLGSVDLRPSNNELIYIIKIR